MKKIIFFLAILCTWTVTSCDDVLDTKPGDTYSEADIYNDTDLADRLLLYSYNCTDTWGENLNNFWCRCTGTENVCDEAFFHWKTTRYSLYRVTAGQLTPNDLGNAFTNLWKDVYSYIRSCDEFLTNIKDSDVMKRDPDKTNQLIAEARFLRAYCYNKLIRQFGGVPLFDKPFKMDDELNVPRNSYEECVDFIVSELDAAAAVLPEYNKGNDFGRADKRACLALKSRVLLYAASKLHDPSTQPSGPLYDYDKASKWQDAADAAKAVIDLPSCQDGLIQVTDAKAYQELFLHPNVNILFARPFNSSYATFDTQIYTLPDKAQSPCGYNGWGLSDPTQNMVDAFRMNNGKAITDPNSGYDEKKRYENRDMRFYADILYNGSSFRGREVEFFNYGKDGLNSILNPDMSKHYNKTGYCMRKFQDETIDFDVEMSADRPYISFRLAEMYMNYAEAMYHLGNENVAREYASKVAQRAHQPAITSSGEQLLDDIKNECQIEFCFEGHRYYDLRRWMDVDHLSGNIRGIKCAYVDAFGNEVKPTYDAEEKLIIPDGAMLKYTVIPKLEYRPWKDAYYYLPIPYTEIEKADKLEQNFGYD